MVGFLVPVKDGTIDNLQQKSLVADSSLTQNKELEIHQLQKGHENEVWKQSKFFDHYIFPPNSDSATIMNLQSDGS